MVDSRSNGLHTCVVEVGHDSKSLGLFSFGGMILSEKITDHGTFKSMAKLESKMRNSRNLKEWEWLISSSIRRRTVAGTDHSVMASRENVSSPIKFDFIIVGKCVIISNLQSRVRRSLSCHKNRMEYSSSTQMENQMESGKKDVITKEELNDHYSTVSNAGDRRMQSENAMRTKDSVKEEISTAEVENTDCHESTKPDKQRASKSASFGSHLKKEEISYVLGTMVFPPEMSLSSLYCPSSTPEETMTNKMQEVGRAQSSNSCGIRVGAFVDMPVSLVRNKVPDIPASTFISTSSLKVPMKRPATVESSPIEMKSNGSTVRNAPASDTTSSADTVANEHSIRESESDHDDGCSPGDAGMKETGLPNQHYMKNITNDAKGDCDEGQFGCLDCTAVFETKAAFKLHIASHPGYRRFKCTVCEQRSTTKQNLMVHMRRHTGEKPFKCDVCQKKFNTDGELTKHKRIHTGERPFECNVCEKNFTIRANLIVHERIHAGENPYICQTCGQGFNHKISLHRHQRRQHADPNADTIPHVSHLQHLPSSVPQADASWESSPMEKFIITDSPKADMIPAKRPATIEPTLIETKINGSSSPDTGRSKHSVRKSGLGDHNDGGPDVDDDMNEIGLSNQRHAEANTNNATDDCDGGQFACLDCTAMFETKAAFKKHIATHEGYRRHKCTVCEKRFTTNKNLMVHMRRHKGERPFKCDICDKKFTTCGELTIHMRIHTGERPFKCNVCEKKFANSGNLIVHERSHTGERPFKCDICDKKCTTRSDLTVHKRIHTGEKPFGCDICEKKFTTSGHLTIHKRIHTGERLYKCDTCEKKFINISHLIEHTRIHTGERPFVCPTCQKRFSRSGDLHRHTLSHTGEKPLQWCSRFTFDYLDPDADMQPDVSHLRHLPSSAPQADGSRESSPMEEFIITD